MTDERHPSPAEETRRLHEEAETRTARAFETLVSREGFGELLARVTENLVALTKIGTDSFDLVLRNLRLAGRPPWRPYRPDRRIQGAQRDLAGHRPVAQ
jgi:hypothetical protein